MQRLSEADRSGYTEVTGVVLKSTPVGEYDRRVVLLTKEKGKVAAFARGARRPTSALVAAAQPFAFGTFRLYAGRDAFSLTEASLQHSFEALKTDVTGVCVGSYFLEVLDYITRENMDTQDLLLLCYAALRALEKKTLSPELIRSVFELRTVMQEGEFAFPPAGSLLPGTEKALTHIAQSGFGSLFSFAVSDPVKEELRQVADRARSRAYPHTFSSLRILEALQ